jgi:hypothetical protein
LNDRTRVTMCAALGALAGGVAGYLLMTERGRSLRTELEPRLDDLMGEVQRLGAAFERTRRAVDEGWRSFSHLASESPAPEGVAEPWKPGRRSEGRGI